MKNTFLLTVSVSALAGFVLRSYVHQAELAHLRFAIVVVMLGAAIIGLVRLVRRLDERTP